MTVTNQVLALWPRPMAPADPNAKPISATEGNPGDNPTLTTFLLPGDQTRGLVLVCPGGGYEMLASHETDPIAAMLNAAGFHAGVLRYRLGPRHCHPAILHDAQRAMRLIRHHAGPWRVRPDAVAVLGFSAGGHLAASLAVNHDKFTCPDDDLAPRYSARPDAAVLCYAVTDLSKHAPRLLGPAPDPQAMDLLTLPPRVSPQTPPTFLWHTADDPVVAVQNSVRFATACREKAVPVELHIYETGSHGMGLAKAHTSISTWTQLCTLFLHRHLTRP